MDIIDVVLFFCLCCVCVYSAVSDIKKGIISNTILLAFGSIGIILDVLNYGFLHREYIATFLVNVILAVGSALFFYTVHIWAGGDSKMLTVVALLYPASFCFTSRGNNSTFYFVVMYSFAIGFLYLVVSSVAERIRKKKSIDKSLIIKTVKSFFVRYLLLTIYSALFTIINSIFISKYFILNALSLSIIYFAIPWIVSKTSFLQKKAIILIILCADIVLAIFYKVLPIDIRLRSYLIILVSAIIQALLLEFNYETIRTADVQKGMILSLPTTMLFMNSRVKGLPGLSKEDLSSRLTEEEAESVRRWENSTTGKKEIIIVRKIPFAIFISAGVLFYLIFGFFFG